VTKENLRAFLPAARWSTGTRPLTSRTGKTRRIQPIGTPDTRVRPDVPPRTAVCYNPTS